MNAEEFAAKKFDLQEGGRWCELDAGVVRTFHPPDDLHGNFVLNFSKQLAAAARSSPDPPRFAGYELGLIVARRPDTVRCPPISVFTGADAFAESDKTITETRPDWIIEIASTNDRREAMSGRLEEFRKWGVVLMWVADPQIPCVHVLRSGRPNRRYDADDILPHTPLLGETEIKPSELFADPAWWR